MPTLAQTFPAHTVRNGITVVYSCALLDYLFPAGWTLMDPDVWGQAMVDWLNANDAHLHAWEGPSYLRLAEEDNAVDLAIESRKSIVVVDPLS